MKLLICSILLMLYSCAAQAQSVQSVPYPFLNQPISLFRDSLICVVNMDLGKTYDEKPDCLSFRHTDSLAIYRYGSVAFYGVILSVDTPKGVINYIMHFKSSLWGVDSVNVKKDFRILTAFFDSTMGKRTPVKRPLQEREKELIWRSPSHQISLQLITFERKKGRKVAAILNLSIEQLKKNP
jgi:hypothetical protein